MTANSQDRLSAAVLRIAFAAIVAVVFLDFYLPHIEAYWDYTRSPPYLIMMLIRLSHITKNFWVASPTFGIFIASIVWRVLARRRLHQSARARGFDITPTTGAR
jgi:type II secretory pathway component PulF